MKRKLWVILSLVLILSIAYRSAAFAANPVVDTFLGGSVYLNSMISQTTGYGSLSYSNSGHPGTTYTNYVLITYRYESTIFPGQITTKTKSASVQNGNASVSYNAPTFTESYSVTSHGNISQLGEIWVGETSVITY